MTAKAGSGRVVVVTAGGRNPQILINALADRFTDVTVFLEDAESRALFLRRRARKLGLVVALGQFATMVVSRFGKRFTEGRAAEIMAQFGVSDRPRAGVNTVAISSVNDADAIRAIVALAPDAVFLVSCRMLRAATLAAMPCPVINFHAGINPHYRGLMGGYWARVRGDLDNFGATVHLVDAGVDTGSVLYQARMVPDRRDTIHTYPLLQTAGATGIAVRAVEDAVSGRLAPVPVKGPSRQWYHPPLWTWAWHGIRRGIW